tara:strand:- start:79 stop:642 length:564 start_codon:yes stop_codon:yes gene_type:complete
MSYYSNIVSIVPTDIYSNVTVAEYSNLSVEEQANYLECNYYSSNTVGYYSNLMVYDGINVFSNISSNAYNELTSELKSGYTPVVEYSNVTTTDSPHHYVKVVTHYSNLVVSNVVTYSNIDANAYANLVTTRPSYTVFKKYVPHGYFEISVQEYATKSLEERVEYVSETVPEAIVSNLQPYYTFVPSP